MEQKSNAFLETQPVGSLMRKYAVPCIISLLVAALYNIVDQIFIANASYLGSYGNAANTVVYPLTVLALSLATLVGDGCCAYVSICLGSNKKEDAHKSVGSAIVLTVVIGLLLAAIYAIFMEPILTLFGGKVNDETYACAHEYFVWITAGIPFYVFGQAMNPIIRSDGSPKFAMISTVSGAIVNVILDPIFIYVFKWGMMGAALATILGQILTAVLAVWYLFHMKAIKLHRNSFGFHFRLVRGYLPLGVGSFLSQFSLVISMAVMQNMCTKYGALDPVFGLEEYSQIPLAVLGIVMKFFQIVISITIGLAAGCAPIAGYNVGASRKDRVKKLFSYLLLAELIVGVVALLIVEIFPKQLIGLFGAANESSYYTEFAVKAFRTYLCLMPLATLNKGTFIYMQAMGKPIVSTIISLMREIVFGVGFAILLPAIFGLDGLLYSFPAADLVTFVIALFFIIRTYRELREPAAAAA